MCNETNRLWNCIAHSSAFGTDFKHTLVHEILSDDKYEMKVMVTTMTSRVLNKF